MKLLIKEFTDCIFKGKVMKNTNFQKLCVPCKKTGRLFKRLPITCVDKKINEHHYLYLSLIKTVDMKNGYMSVLGVSVKKKNQFKFI